jgi:CheY-like chemotaxis protein
LLINRNVIQPNAGPGLEGRRVLIVEDADDIRDLLAFLVRLEGADVRTAPDARAALETATSWEFDVLLTDLGLPDMPGDLLIKQLRSMRTRRPRVVVVTGFGEPYLARARQAGADAVFVKPVEWSSLRAELGWRDRALVA